MRSNPESFRKRAVIVAAIVGCLVNSGCTLPDDEHVLRVRDRYRMQAHHQLEIKHYADAASNFERAARESERLRGTRLYQAADLVDCGIAHSAGGDLAKAQEELIAASKLFAEAPESEFAQGSEDFILAMSTCYRELARVHLQQENRLAAKKCLDDALKHYDLWLSQRGRDPLLMQDQSTCRRLLADLSNASPSNNAVVASVPPLLFDGNPANHIENSSAPNDPRIDADSDQLDSEGCALHQLAKYDQAEAKFRQCAKLRERAGSSANAPDSDQLRLAIAYEHLADALLCQNKMSDALEFYQKALPIKRQLDNKQGLHYCLRQTAKTLFQTGKYAAAAEMFEYSYNLEKQLKSDRATRLDTLSNLAESYTRSGKRIEAATVRRQMQSI